MSREDNIVVGLDVGTSKVCAVAAEIGPDGLINLLGSGVCSSKGLRKGMVVDIVATVDSIRQAVAKCEDVSGCQVSSVYVGIAGGHVKSIHSAGSVAIKGSEITARDVDKVIEAARAIAIPLEREILHVFPQQYAVDDFNEIKNPIGMSGVRLEAKVHIITAAAVSAQNIIKCVNRAGLTICDIILEPLASAESVLTKGEKSMGAALLDIGGGTCDLSVIVKDLIKHSFVLPFAGASLTNDLAVGLSIPENEAEALKLKYGRCLPAIDDQELVPIPGLGTRQPRYIQRGLIAEILKSRMDEILLLVKDEILNKNLQFQIPAGLIITGGGALLPGCTGAAEAVFGVPVRIGGPNMGAKNALSHPMYATAVGLMQYGARVCAKERVAQSESALLYKILATVRNWLGAVLK